MIEGIPYDSDFDRGGNITQMNSAVLFSVYNPVYLQKPILPVYACNCRTCA